MSIRYSNYPSATPSHFEQPAMNEPAKKTYRFYLKSSDVGTAANHIEVKRFLLALDDKAFINHLEDYQVAVESFCLQSKASTKEDIVVDLIMKNKTLRDTYDSKYKTPTNILYRGVATHGFAQPITYDTVGVKASDLNLSTGQTLDLQLVGTFETLTDTTFGSDSLDGNWILTLVVYPVKK